MKIVWIQFKNHRTEEKSVKTKLKFRHVAPKITGTSCRVVRSQFWGSGSCHPTTGGCVQWGGVRVSELNFEGRVGPHAAVGRGSHNPPTQASHRVKNPQKRCSSKTIQVIHWTVTSDQGSIEEKVENSRQMQWKESLEWKSVLSPFTVPSLSFLGRNHRRKNGT